MGWWGWRGYTYIPYQMGPKTARRAYLHTLSDVPQIYPPPWIPEPRPELLRTELIEKGRFKNITNGAGGGAGAYS